MSQIITSLNDALLTAQLELAKAAERGSLLVAIFSASEDGLTMHRITHKFDKGLFKPCVALLYENLMEEAEPKPLPADPLPPAPEFLEDNDE